MSALASPELCAFVHKQAPPHYGTPDAPETYRALRAWYHSGEVKMPVSDRNCDRTIYPDAATNIAFRAWHESIHLAQGYSFKRADEIKVGLIHMQQARRAGLSQRDQDMLIADTIGQTEYYNERGCFVNDQARFVQDVLHKGLRAVLDDGKYY